MEHPFAGTPLLLAPIGAIPNANAASISGGTLNLQPASAAFGGVVTTGAQTFAGLKNFQDGIQLAGSTFTPTAFGPIGAAPNANGGVISAGGVINLEPASAAFGGLVTTGAQTFAGLKNFQDGLQVGGTTLPFQVEAPQGTTPTLTGGAISTSTGVPTFTNSIVGTVKSVYIAGFQVTTYTGTPTSLEYNTGNVMNATYRPFTALWFACNIEDNSLPVLGRCVIGTGGQISIQKADSTAFTGVFGIPEGLCFNWNA